MRRTLTITALAAAMVLADTLLWISATRVLASAIDGWSAQAQAHGWVVASGVRAIGGWPFKASLTIEKAGLAGGGRSLPGGLRWSADRVVVSVSLTHPLTLCVAVEGQQFLQVSHAPDIGFVAQHEVARWPLLARHIEGDLEAVGIAGGIAGSRHPQDVQLAMLSIHLRQDAPAKNSAAPVAAELDVKMRGIGLPDIGRWPLGATIAGAGALITVSSPKLSKSPAADQDNGAEAQAAAWRDGGGRLSLHGLTLRWGPLDVDAQADFGLDGRLQPQGAGVAELAGTAPALDAAVSAGLLPAGLAATAKAMLAVMPHLTRQDGSEAVHLPFVLRDSTLSVAEIPLARLHGIVWQRGRPP